MSNSLQLRCVSSFHHLHMFMQTKLSRNLMYSFTLTIEYFRLSPFHYCLPPFCLPTTSPFIHHCYLASDNEGSFISLCLPTNSYLDSFVNFPIIFSLLIQLADFAIHYNCFTCSFVLINSFKLYISIYFSKRSTTQYSKLHVYMNIQHAHKLDAGTSKGNNWNQTIHHCFIHLFWWMDGGGM